MCPSLKVVLETRTDVYFTGFTAGVDALAGFSVADLVGTEYTELWLALRTIYSIRNKVFHGQLTSRSLARRELLEMVATVRRWCELLAFGAQREVGYDGFGGSSFHKSCEALAASYKQQLASLDDYRQFIDRHVAGRMRW